MGRGKDLEPHELGQIDALMGEKKSISYIAAHIKRSRTAISNYLQKGPNYGVSPRSGRPPAVSPRETKAILKAVKNKPISARKIKEMFDLKVSNNTILRIIKDKGGMALRKMKRKPVLTDDHKANRVLFAKRYMDLGNGWKHTIFSDEKKFNLDGPDGYAYYWHAVDGSSPLLSHRAFGGGSIMVWACFDDFGKSQLVFIEGGIDSVKYQNALNDNLLPFLAERDNIQALFQQDNARPHVSKSSIAWLKERDIKCMEWPAYSPDLNPIENLWGILVQRVYANGRQFSDIGQLKETLIKEWEEINMDVLHDLILSMRERIFEVLIKKGANTKY